MNFLNLFSCVLCNHTLLQAVQIECKCCENEKQNEKSFAALFFLSFKDNITKFVIYFLIQF